MSAFQSSNNDEEDKDAILKEVFESFDKDGNGSIDLKELNTIMRSLGYSPTQEQLQNMLRKGDKNHDGSIDFDEFVALMNSTECSTDFQREVEDAFNFFDANHDGSVSADELASVMRTLGNKLSEEEINLLLKCADSNGDGSISLKEFITFMYDS